MALDNLRQRIDTIDDQLIDILGARLNIVREVATFKKQNATPVMQPGRVEEVKARCRARAEKFELRGEFINALYDLIIAEACQIEDEAMAKAD